MSSISSEDWRQCYDWLVRCGVLIAGDHPPRSFAPPVLSPPTGADGLQVHNLRSMLPGLGLAYVLNVI